MIQEAKSSVKYFVRQHCAEEFNSGVKGLNNRHCSVGLILTTLTLELNPSAQRCLPRYFTGDFNFQSAHYATSL
jgi:hypothetical protein